MEQVTRATLINNIPGYTAETSTFAFDDWCHDWHYVAHYRDFHVHLGRSKNLDVWRHAGARYPNACHHRRIILANPNARCGRRCDGAGLLMLTELILPKTMPFYANSILLFSALRRR